MSTKPLSSDQLSKYAILWNKFGSKPFEFEQVKQILKMEENNLIVTLHRIKSRGWLVTKRQKDNPRKSVYTLISPNDAVRAISK